MCGLLSNINLPFSFEEKRNDIVAIIAGALFFAGWWFAIDIAVMYTGTQDMKPVFHICGIFGTISLIMVNMVSNDQLNGVGFREGCMGQQGAKIWFFIGLIIGFGALTGSLWILIANYLVQGDQSPFKPNHVYPGWAIFLQNSFILASSTLYRFGRQDFSFI